MRVCVCVCVLGRGLGDRERVFQRQNHGEFAPEKRRFGFDMIFPVITTKSKETTSLLIVTKSLN